MTKKPEPRPKWAEEFLRNLKPKTPEELAKARAAFEWAWANRIDIRPMTTTELIRKMRDGG